MAGSERKLRVRLRVRPGLRVGRPLAVEAAHVGVAEAVDRLQAVADQEPVLLAQRVEQLDLEAVRVLELVDHHALQALGVRRGDLRAAAQQVARRDREVRVVEPAAAAAWPR